MTSKQPILVTGGHGQVGSALGRLLGPEALVVDREELDLLDPAALSTKLDVWKPRAVINPAAYTQVDKAETDVEAARVINGVAPGILAQWCAKAHVPFVHFSTDYVFPGNGDCPWSESDPTAPLNTYGETKLLGERAVLEAGARSLILRTSWVFNETGQNFVNTMLRLGAEREELKVVADQIGAPTYAGDLAEMVLAMLDKALTMNQFPSGVYHVCGAGETSWCGFAEAIFAEAKSLGWTLRIKSVQGISSEQYPTPAKRPRNSRMSMAKLRQVFDLQMPAWQDGLRMCLEAKSAVQ